MSVETAERKDLGQCYSSCNRSDFVGIGKVNDQVCVLYDVVRIDILEAAQKHVMPKVEQVTELL